MNDLSIRQKRHLRSYQKIVDEQINKLLEVCNYPVGIPEFPQLIPINNSTPWRVGTEPTESSKQEIMLASVPKVAISIAMVRVLESLQIQENKISLDADTILELLGRDSDSVLNPESNQYGTYAQVREVLNSLGITSLEDIKSTDKFESKKQAIKDALRDLKVEVDLSELLRQVLTLSSNNATRIAKQLIVSSGQDINIKLKELVPMYSPSPADMSKLQHYYETDKPNVGPIYEHAEILHQLVGRVFANRDKSKKSESQKTKKEDPTTSKSDESGKSEGEIMLVDSLTNNPVDFDFDFTHSDLGKILISKGYRIVEKTGYYPCVYWVSAFADPQNPIPPHMVMCTIFSIISPEPENKVIGTFAHQRLFKVRLPIEKSATTINGEKVEEPNEHDPSYTVAYIRPIKQQAAKLFREECTRSVLDVLDSKELGVGVEQLIQGSPQEK